MRVGLAQLNLRLGDLDGNAAMVIAAYDEAVGAGARVVVFSELTVTGYPPEDLLLKPAFVDGAAAALERIAQHTGDVPAVVGFPEDTGRGGPVRLWNSAALCWGGAVRGVFRKHLLPNYAVFDEQRYFVPGTDAGPLLQVGDVRVGVSICEDLWGPPRTADASPEDGGLPSIVGGDADTSPALAQVAMGAQLLVNLNGSPYRRGKQADREAVARTRAAALGVPVVYVNQVGGQDELVFDGSSFVADASGQVICRLEAFAPQVAVCEVPLAGEAAAAGGVLAAPPDPLEEVWQALVVATRDYVRKNGFSDVAVGLSGGIDSSAVAAIAADALGPEHVHGVSMPSRYSSEGSRTDAAELAANLGIDFRTVPIEPAHVALAGMLEASAGTGPADADPAHDRAAADLTDQNLQSRIRGVLLMALSNRFGWLVLTTGNKTETSVGYTTLYGDTAGAYAVIRDVPKLLVYELCRWRNRQGDGERIPEACIDKPPSAELRPDQRDDQSLPPYELLDPLVEAYVEGDLSAAEMLEQPELLDQYGTDPDVVHRITRLVDVAEYKRRQSPPGPRITAKSFGKDRRMPITNFFR
ncbi:MAG: NAD+ synthase [Acidimicrobiales bacterium]|nr:NAD+ synthase [Acidimicrobiales bacterium]MXX42909.1 NAD+ synthase [Acidimicrobiales bacterium]MYI08799.1 NAD+ synthase [Acidimicrobiales bacterium]MYI13783.1 NAD+ synthase [Acidimicrobiales bacterium]